MEGISEQFSRTELLLGKQGMDKLKQAKVIIFGVGGYVAEALARSGIHNISLVDKDTVSESNINRQIIATYKSIGRYKTEVMKERILDINPDANVEVFNCFYLPESKEEFDFSKYDFVIDAVDTVTAKIDIVVECDKNQVPVISSMGAGNKLEASMFKVSDIYKTSVCPLARVMRKELKARGIKKLKVVYSEETPITPNVSSEEIPEGKRQIPGSVAFVPSVAGLIIAGEVVKFLC